MAVSKFTLGQAYFFFQNINYILVRSRSNTDRVGDSGKYYDVLNDHIHSGRHQHHNNVSHVYHPLWVGSFNMELKWIMKMLHMTDVVVILMPHRVNVVTLYIIVRTRITNPISV